MHRRLIVGSVVVAVAVAVAAPTAVADGGGFGFTDGPNIGAGAGDATSTAPQHGNGHQSAQHCEYASLNPDDAAMYDRLVNEGLWSQRSTGGSGAWYRQVCSDATGPLWATVVWVPQRVNPQQLAEQALNEVPLPRPAINMNPSSDEGALTNVETWLWIDPSQWRPVSASAGAGNVSVTTTATPDHVVFDMGNGDQVICAGSGTPYSPDRPAADQSTDCSYTYRHSSADQPGSTYTVTATVFYSVAWNATGIAAGGVLAPVTQSSSVPVRVAEIQALNQ